MSKSILVCLNKLDIGGVETAVINQTIELLERGYNVVILSKNGIYTEKMVAKGAICIDFDYELTDGYDLKRAERIEKIIKEYGITQIHIHQFDCITSCFPAALNTNTPYVAFVHTGIMGTYDWFEEHFISYKTVYNLYFNMAYRIVAITEKAKNENQSKYNVDDSKYIIINNSINFDKKLIENNNIPQIIKNFLIVSRLAPEKINSIKNAINVFRMYNKINKESHLTIVGTGEIEKEILEEIEDIKPNTTFLGARDDVIDIMLQNDVVIALDRCILEAIGAKRIAVISGYQSLKGIVTYENIEKAAKCNFSGDNLEEESIDNILNSLKQLKKEEIEKLVNQNFQFALDNLNSKKNVYVIEDVLDKLNIDKKIYFQNQEILFKEIAECKKKQEEIYFEVKEAQKYFEKQLENKEKECEELKHEIQKLKLLNQKNQEKINSGCKNYDKIKNELEEITDSKRWKISNNIANIINKLKRKR